MLLVLPLVAAALALLPLFIVALQMSIPARGAAITAPSSRLSSAQP
ncbi:MAG TPA: hypothetical protein VLN61_02795 [Pseudolabrys sp.]|nr:hypothetical protein [Pseudolabrys sp.]